MMKDLIKIAFLGVLLIALLIPMTAHGLIITYEFNWEYTEEAPPGGPTPWLVANFSDEFEGAEENQVMLTIFAVNLVEQECVSGIFFNFDPDQDPDLLTFTPIDNSASVPNGIYTVTNAFSAGGGALYDIWLDQPPPSRGDPRLNFTGGEEVSYLLGYDSEDYVIDAGSFNYESVGNNQNIFNAAAHIQRIDPEAAYSGWVAPHCVPEPTTILLFGSLLIAIGLLKRRF